MGSSNSTEHLLEVPLYAQSPPVLATSLGSNAPQFTSLCIQHRSTRGRDYEVLDAATQSRVFVFKHKAFSSRCTLQAPDGRAIVNMASRFSSPNHRLYERDETETMSLELHVQWSGGLLIYADFYDRLSGRECRVVLNGNSYDRVALFYIEFGQPSLLSKPKRKDFLGTGRFHVIGRVRRPNHKQQFVEAAPGVDVTLLLMLWRLWDKIEQQRQSD